MKNFFFYLFAFLFTFNVLSCKSDDDNVDNDTIAVVYDLSHQNFAWVQNSWQISRVFSVPLYDSDMVLVYQQVGITNNGAPIWQQIPITLYLEDGNEVDYNFDFSKYDFVIYAGGTFDLTGTSYIANQTFRVVVIPAGFGKSANVDFSNYQSVIDSYHIDDSNPEAL